MGLFDSSWTGKSDRRDRGGGRISVPGGSSPQTDQGGHIVSHRPCHHGPACPHGFNTLRRENVFSHNQCTNYRDDIIFLLILLRLLQ